MGLRVRLLLLVGAVVSASLATVAFYSREVASRAFIEVSAESEYVGPAVDFGDLGQDLGEPFDPAEPAAWAAALAGLAESVGQTHWLVAFDADRAMVAISDAELADASVTLDAAGELTIERRGLGGDGVEQLETMQVRAPLVALSDDLGATYGYIAAVPRPEATEFQVVDQQQVFRTSVGRNLLGGVAIVGLLALLATYLVGARLLGPIEALTQGARRMARGEFDARVSTRRTDEVGVLAGAFNEMADSLESVERWRQNMLNDTAHELRTPLTNLRCRIEAMEDGLAPLNAQALGALGHDVERLSRLVDDLRDLALAEARQLVIDREPVVLSDVVRRVVGSLADRGERVMVATSGDDRIEADPLRIEQIIDNLVRNALIHGGDDSVVNIRITGGASTVIVDVEDSGPGLAQTEIPHLFERFYRSGAQHAEMRSGLGLGLAIVRELVRAHGGEVSASNRQNGGARFRITLPRKPGARHG